VVLIVGHFSESLSWNQIFKVLLSNLGQVLVYGSGANLPDGKAIALQNFLGDLILLKYFELFKGWEILDSVQLSFAFVTNSDFLFE